MAARGRHQSRRGVLLGAGGRQPHAQGRPAGAIVNIASVLGFGVSKGTAAYATAKAGVIQMTKALGLELAFKGVRVNAIAPGWFVTDINREYLSSEAGKKLTREFRSAASARMAISTARCCCWRRMPALYRRRHHRLRWWPDGRAEGLTPEGGRERGG